MVRYKEHGLLIFAKELGFPLQSESSWNQEIEAYLHLVRYSKGLVLNVNIPMVLDNISTNLSPFDLTLLLNEE